MKKGIYIALFIICFACNSEDASDCFQTEGDTVVSAFELPVFTKIRIEDDVSLLLRQGPVQEVLIETGANLLNDVSVVVDGETLVVKDNNGCNYVRDYRVTRAIVTVPNLTEIRNSSEADVVGDGLLEFPRLHLISNSTGNIPGTRKSGDFRLNINSENLTVEANGFSGFYMSGFSENAFVSFEDEVPRFEGAQLIVNDLRILHRSGNKMIVNPQERIRGKILGVGDVISINTPPIVEVEEIFTGRLIFQD